MAGTAAQTRDTSHMVLFDVIPETAALRTVDVSTSKNTLVV